MTQRILVCLPIGFHSLNNLNNGTKISWKAHIALVYPRFRKYLNLYKTYYNASMTRPYIGYKDKSNSKRYFEKIKKIWDERDVLLIEGEKISFRGLIMTFFLIPKNLKEF